ncbi:unnamed protein product [Soboliphyme baturini]|uniref:KH_dom_type_1 domain-containing protein n=1 Tax=Soboliphyme baturini TaxID=241478 RepID=A0A183J4H1_9BILA|nr:unnamed protein product [Soboliphyme baturini]
MDRNRALRRNNKGLALDGFHPRPNISDIPLRMVVGSKYVGAIIGQGGANIRQITKDSKAR